MKKRALLFLVSFGLLAVLIYFSNPGKILESLLLADMRFIGLALIFWFLNLLAKTYKWNFLLKKTGIQISLLKTMKYYIAGIFVSNLSPAKTADPIRAVFLKKMENKGFSKGLSSIFTERIISISSLAGIAILGMLILVPSNRFLFWVYMALLIYLSGIIFVIYLIFSGDKFERVLRKIISIFHFIPKVGTLGERVEEFSGKFRDSLRRYQSRGIIFWTFVLSILVWVLNGLKGFFLFLSLGVYISPLVIVTVLCVSILLSILTFLPGGIGSGEIISVSLLSLFVTVSISKLTTGIILGRLTGFWIYAVLGALLISTFDEKKLDLNV